MKHLLVTLLSFYLLGYSSDNSLFRVSQPAPGPDTGTLEKLKIANGTLSLELDINRLNGIRSKAQIQQLRFNVAPDSFLTSIAFNGEFRGLQSGSLTILPQEASAKAPAYLKNSLILESIPWGEAYELTIRDEQTGLLLFNIESHEFDYAGDKHSLVVKGGKLLLGKDLAEKLGRPADEGAIVGTLSLSANMTAIEITQLVNGETQSSVMPTVGPTGLERVPGPDVIVGALSGLAQFGSSSGTRVGLAVGTDSCNLGNVPLNWFANPTNDHPVIPQNLYRMSGGAGNDERFEQIGQSNVKHAFTALQQDICGLGCSATSSTWLGSGCSDPYSASLNSGGANNSLGSRAWINPFTGAYPRNDSPTPNNAHAGHSHNGTSHRILVEMDDLNTTLNTGATYYVEAQYVTPHEYAWCQANPGQCNMSNNASHRRYNVNGTTSFSFSAVGGTVQEKAAIQAWTGATIVKIDPAPGTDGFGFIAYKVTNPSPGVWHYEYAIYNQNMDRAIQSFRVPVSASTNLTNIGFHAPPQHPGWANDGTVGGAGYSSTPWAQTRGAGDLTWASETFAQNQNANAIRWGTLYNFRFDSNRPPETTNATIGFYKTGSPIQVAIQGPSLQSTLSINDVTVTEGNAGTVTANFTVSLTPASTDPVSVQYATANGLATAGTDYAAAGGTVNFTPGQVSQPVSITVNGDTIEEFNETFFVNLSNATNANIGDAQGVGTITNDDFTASLQSGFAETQITGLSSPTAMAVHPDGRVFVCQQGGQLRVIKDGVVLPTPFTTLTVNSSGERGLLGVAFDPNYATNRFVYVYYTATTPTIHNRVSRFTADAANEDVAVAGSEVVLMDLETLSATNHNGGAIHFGPDGKLYIATGENAVASNAQSLSNRLGKILRINSDGTIPADNPIAFPNIAGTTTGLNRAIWAVGLRNPFTFTFQQGTGRMHINDVGQNTWEEINLGAAGANYGWPTCEGSCGTANMTNPIYQYSSASGPNCAITGGAFYNPTTPTFPAQYIGKYFFADFCGGWLKTIDPLAPPATGTAPDFATGINLPVDMQVANDGSLYYLARGSNSVFRVQYFGGSTLAINNVTITEGNSGTSTANFTVLLSPASSQTVTVQYATAPGTATAGSDYTTANGTLTFAPGQTSQNISVLVLGDLLFEPTETFNVNLSNPTNATLGNSQGVGTIIDNDSPPTISVNDVAILEGHAGTKTAVFTISLSNPTGQNVTVNFATADSNATAGSDYAALTGVATITAGLPSTSIAVTINGDTVFEGDESFFFNLSNPTNATIADSFGIGTINNDDPVPAISINDVSVTEGNAGTTTAAFTVSLTNASSQTINVDYTTGNSTATAGSDYVASTATVTFSPGQTTRPLNITVNSDTVFEPNESFTVNLSGASNATISDTQGVGTITNDDSQPTISINDVTVTEGNAGTTNATFTVSLSNASSEAISANYTTADGTASAGSDYVLNSGSVSFAAGEVSKSITVTVNGDTMFEGNETFNVNLSNAVAATFADSQGAGTINNDDSQPTITINDVSLSEGNAGTSTAAFTVTLSNASSQAIAVNYTTANVSATAGSDYVLASGTLNFAPGTLTQPINVTVNGDTMFEPNETFNINLTLPANATINDNPGVGTINNDDSQPTISINDVSVNEGNTATSTTSFTVSLSNASSQTITVNFATANNTAIAGTHYVATNGTVSFAPGEVSQPVNVTINGDVLTEPPSVTFNVNLTTPANATIADNQGVGTITDDDNPALATEENSQRAIALDVVTFVREPFAITNPFYFGSDHRTRIMLVATNLTGSPTITAQAVDSVLTNYNLTVEFVGPMPGHPELTQIVVKLPDGILVAGDLQVTVTAHSKTSNVVLIGVRP